MNARANGWGAWTWAVALVALAAMAWLAASRLGEARGQVADDAYITYVYGRHVAEGRGLVYNAGDAEPTPGASSLLHVLLAAVFEAAGADPLLATRALSLLALLSVPLAVAWAARAVRAPGGAAPPPGAGLAAGALVGLALASVGETADHLAQGMETMLFAALHAWVAAWAVHAAARGASGAGRAAWTPAAWSRAVGPALLLAAFCLARPEGFPLAGATLLAAAIAAALLRSPSAHSGRSSAGAVGPVAVLWGCVLVGFVAWKLATFGRLPSNPYYAKTHNAIFGGEPELWPGLRTTVRFLVLRAGPLAGLVGAGCAVAGVPRRVVLAGAVLLAPSLGMAVAYAHVIHEMAGGFRYEYPLMLPLVVATGLVLAVLAARSPRAALVRALGVGVAAPLLFLPADVRLLDWLVAPAHATTRWTRWSNDDLAHARLGLDLGETGLGGEATILLSGAGMVPYFSRFRAIDWIGLNDNYLSGREPRTLDEVWAYLEAQSPDVVFSILPPASPGVERPGDDPAFAIPLVQGILDGRASALFRFWDRVKLAEMFHREMRFVRDRFEFGAAYHLGRAWGRDWWILAYVRRDSPHRDALMRVLSSSTRADRDSDLSATYGFDPRELGRSPGAH